MDNKILEIRGVTKSYPNGKKPALSDFSYSFEKGVYGILGQNGAGKSTLLNLIVTNLKPDKGEVLYRGRNIIKLGSDYRKRIGYMPQQQGLYDDFKVKTFLFYMAALKGMPRKRALSEIADLMEVVGLSDSMNRRLKELSGGMKQRILIVQALLNNPEIVILDEPTAGLDPGERINIRNFIHSISTDRTILLATHVISDIEVISREIILMKGGRIIEEGNPEDINCRYRDKIYETIIPGSEYMNFSAKCKANRIIAEKNNSILIHYSDEVESKTNSKKASFVSLEDVYMHLYMSISE